MDTNSIESWSKSFFNKGTALVFGVIILIATIAIIFFSNRSESAARDKADTKIREDFGKTGAELLKKTARDSAAIWKLITVSIRLDSLANLHDAQLKDFQDKVVELEKKICHSSSNSKTIKSLVTQISELNIRIEYLAKKKEEIKPAPIVPVVEPVENKSRELPSVNGGEFPSFEGGELPSVNGGELPF